MTREEAIKECRREVKEIETTSWCPLFRDKEISCTSICRAFVAPKPLILEYTFMNKDDNKFFYVVHSDCLMMQRKEE